MEVVFGNVPLTILAREDDWESDHGKFDQAMSLGVQ